MSWEDEYVRVGSVTRSHGLRGQVVVDLAPGAWYVLEGVKTLWVKGDEPRAFHLVKVHPAGRNLVLAFEELRRREESDALRGVELWALRSEVELPQGEVATQDLLGLEVRLEDGSLLGALEDVWPTGANDVYVVRGERGEWLLPATDQVVLSQDLAARRLVVRLLPGLEPTPGKSGAVKRAADE